MIQFDWPDADNWPNFRDTDDGGTDVLRSY